jgi:putative CocE/NonD family hydrolase
VFRRSAARPSRRAANAKFIVPAVASEVLRLWMLLTLLVAAFGIRTAAAAESPSIRPYYVEPSYDGVDARSRYIRSLDGTRLAVTVYRPTLKGAVVAERLPVIVQQFSGDPDARFEPTIRYFTNRGYIWVAQSRRGTGASFGRQTGFITESDAKDARATIEWAGEQSFSSGKVGAFGCSNQGAWQYSVAALKPKYLVAITPQCASPAIFDDGISVNGINSLSLAENPYSGECSAPSMTLRAPAPASSRPVNDDHDGSLLAAALAEQECGADFLGQYWLNMPRDGLNTYAGNLPAIADSPLHQWRDVRDSGVAILQIGGWFDSPVMGQLEGQRIWGGRVYMVPRSHGNRVTPEMQFPGDLLDINQVVLRWFDHFLKGIENDASVSGITYYTINAAPGTEWRHVPSWPPAGIIPRRYYATPSGLSLSMPSSISAPIIYPQQDVQLFGGAHSLLSRQWEGDMSETDAQSIIHTSAPLQADTEVTGAPIARFWASADQADVNIFAILQDVSPDGRSTYVTEGRLRASWRKIHTPPWGETTRVWHRGYAEDIAPLEPGKPEKLIFSFFPISYVFAKGHRIQLSIVTSLGARFQDPPLAGGKAPTLTLYRDVDRPSSLEIPVIESAD